MSASRTAAAKSAAKIKSSAAATKSGLIDCTTEEFAEEDIKNSKNKRKKEESLPATRKRRSNTTPPATRKRRSLPTPPKSLSKKDHAVKTTCASPSCDEEVAEIDEELMFGEDSADEVGEKSDEVEEDEGEDA
jgi:hypothetical protein